MKRHDHYGISNKLMNIIGSSPLLLEKYICSKAGKDIFRRLSAKGYDVDAFFETPDGKWLVEKIKYELYAPDDSPKTHQYWADRGLMKEVHGRIDQPENYWSIFIPSGSKAEPQKKYPLLFLLHGANNPIRIMQGCGVLDVAAKEKFIVFTPQNEREEYLVDMYYKLIRDYPVDSSRVYIMGFSFGAHMTARMSITHPELFAAVGLGSMMTLGDQEEMRITGMDYPAFRHTKEMIDHAAEVKLPCCMMLGTKEMLKFFPFYDSDLSYAANTTENADNVIRFVIGKDTVFDCFNAFRRLAGCAEIDQSTAKEKSLHSDSETERVTGLLFERTKEITYNDRKYYVGDSINAAGDNLFRLYAVDEALHMPTSAWGPFTWSFMKQFSRDTETKKLHILAET